MKRTNQVKSHKIEQQLKMDLMMMQRDTRLWNYLNNKWWNTQLLTKDWKDTGEYLMKQLLFNSQLDIRSYFYKAYKIYIQLRM